MTKCLTGVPGYVYLSIRRIEPLDKGWRYVKSLLYSDWSLFGWHGLTLEVPLEWNPGKITGDSKSGSVRLDDPTLARLDIEWKDARGDTRVAPIVDRFVDGLAQSARKEKKSLDVERALDMGWLELPDACSPVFFAWQAEDRIHALAFYSAASDRLFFVKIRTKLDEDAGDNISRILNSIRDTAPDGDRTWALYDLVCSSPPQFSLETYDLKSGHLRLCFQHGQNILQFDRLSLAKVLLKKRTLSDWYQEFFRKNLRHVSLDSNETSIGEHFGLTVRGKPKSRWRGLLMPLPFWNARPRLNMEARVWTCDDVNKIYAVHTYYRRQKDAPDIENARRAVVCHRESVADGGIT